MATAYWTILETFEASAPYATDNFEEVKNIVHEYLIDGNVADWRVFRTLGDSIEDVTAIANEAAVEKYLENYDDDPECIPAWVEDFGPKALEQYWYEFQIHDGLIDQHRTY